MNSARAFQVKARFGSFEMDLRAGELRKHGVRIHLQTQPFQILGMLLERPGEVVTREELRQALWSSDTFVDFDHGLNNAVNRLREALGDSAESPRFLETLPRRGYRFIATVESIASPWPQTSKPQVVDCSTTPPAPARDELVAPPLKRSKSSLRTRPWMVASAGVAALFALLITLNTRGLGQRLLRANAARRIQSVAVLPLVNLSGDPSQEYFADGMTDALITNLGKIDSLRVISRTSVMQYKGTKKPLAKIARDLNVDAIIEGTVSRSGNHLRITASLLQASPEKHLCAQSYDSDVGDALTVQGQLAQAVAHEIQVTLSQKERNLLATPRPVNPDAQDLYFRGLHALQSGGAGTSQNAVAYFQGAIKEEPNFADAYGAMAMAYATWYPLDLCPRERMPKAREAALKAVALDNSAASGHLALAYIDLNYDWNFAEAEREFKRALELEPNFAIARDFYARELVILGRTDEAIAEAKLALELEPYSAQDLAAWTFYLARRYEDALAIAQKMVAMDPNYSWGHWALASNYEQLGKQQQAAEEYLRFELLSGAPPQRIKRLQTGLARSGVKGFWQASLADYLETAKSSYAQPVLVAGVCMRLGHKACALEWLENGYRDRDDLMTGLNVDPIFDGIRADPRFQDLVRRVGLPDGKSQT